MPNLYPACPLHASENRCRVVVGGLPAIAGTGKKKAPRFTIGELFHLPHSVSNLAAVDQTSPILSLPSKLLTKEEAPSWRGIASPGAQTDGEEILGREELLPGKMKPLAVPFLPNKIEKLLLSC